MEWWNPRKFIEAEMRRIDEAAARMRRYVEDEHSRAVLRALAARKLELNRMLSELGTPRVPAPPPFRSPR